MSSHTLNPFLSTDTALALVSGPLGLYWFFIFPFNIHLQMIELYSAFTLIVLQTIRHHTVWKLGHNLTYDCDIWYKCNTYYGCYPICYSQCAILMSSMHMCPCNLALTLTIHLCHTYTTLNTCVSPWPSQTVRVAALVGSMYLLMTSRWTGSVLYKSFCSSEPSTNAKRKLSQK